MILAFAAIYLVWGSTYLAIRYAVEDIPPLLTAGTRHLFAGSILYAWARSRSAAPSWPEWRASLLIGALFFLIGHGTLHWAERTVPSGIAALLVATEPLWIATLPLLFQRGMPRLDMRTVAGLTLGLIGVALLLGRSDTEVDLGSLAGVIAILIGTFSWSAGVVIAPKLQLPSDAMLRASTTLLAGAALLYTTATLAGEPQRLDWREVSFRSATSLLYLIVFGSLITYGAYMWLLERCSPTLVATHTYVNPVVAVVLGTALGEESLSTRIVLAGTLILIAVLLIRGASGATSPDDQKVATVQHHAQERRGREGERGDRVGASGSHVDARQLGHQQLGVRRRVQEPKSGPHEPMPVSTRAITPPVPRAEHEP